MPAWITTWFSLGRYGRWGWSALSIVALLVAGATYYMITSDAAVFVIALLVTLAGIGVYRFFKGSAPPAWATVTLFTIPLFMWGFWMIKPDWYGEWRGSGYFLWMVLIAFVLAWFTTHPANAVTSTARKVLVALMILAIVIGAYRKSQEREARMGDIHLGAPLRVVSADGASAGIKQSDGIPGIDAPGEVIIILEPGQPATISVPPGHRWDLVNNYPASGWTTDLGHRDEYGNRIQVFEIVAPATQVELEVAISKCASPQSCAW